MIYINIQRRKHQLKIVYLSDLCFNIVNKVIHFLRDMFYFVLDDLLIRESEIETNLFGY